jgi:hypothetical protein
MTAFNRLSLGGPVAEQAVRERLGHPADRQLSAAPPTPAGSI